MISKTKLQFKVWNIDNKCFLKGWKSLHKYFFSFFNDRRNKEHLGVSFWREPDGYFKICRFTGLKDKNGKEIYEGDIVKCTTNYEKVGIKHIGEVKFESATFIVGSDTMVDSYMTFIELFGDWDIEVIGNIYENPEVVKDGM